MAGWRKIAEGVRPAGGFFHSQCAALTGLTAPRATALLIATAGFHAGHGGGADLDLCARRRPNNMTLASAGFVFVFGGITLSFAR